MSQHEDNYSSDEELIDYEQYQAIINPDSVKDQYQVDGLKMSDIRLATMTINLDLKVKFNLQVICNYIELDQFVRGVRNEGIGIRGEQIERKIRVTKNKKKNNPKNGKYKLKILSGKKTDFYNQCTLSCYPYGYQDDSVRINVKLFPNGKIGMTGIKMIEHAQITMRIVIDKINQLTGKVIFISNKYHLGDPKNFHKKIKNRVNAFKHINQVFNPQQPYDLITFLESINKKKKEQFPRGIYLEKNLSFILSIMELIDTMMIDDAKMGSLDPQPTKEQLEQRSSFTHLLFRLKDDININDDLSDHDNVMAMLSKLGFCNIDFSMMYSHIYNSSPHNSSDHLHKSKFIMSCARLWACKDKYGQNVSGQKFIDNTKSFIEYCSTVRSQSVITDPNEEQYYPDFIFDKNDYQMMETLKEDYLQQLEDDPVQVLTDLINCGDPLKIHQYDHIDMVMNSWSDQITGQTTDLKHYYHDDLIKISNINTSFSPGFTLNRTKFHKILIEKYNLQKCKFEPNYGGINTKFVSTVNCAFHNPELNQLSTICNCKVVSILIFPKISLITGAVSYNQIEEAHQFIIPIMKKEYPNIVVKNIETELELPNVLDVSGKRKTQTNTNTNTNTKYLKKSYILKNKKNKAILKKLKKLDLYQQEE